MSDAEFEASLQSTKPLSLAKIPFASKVVQLTRLMNHEERMNIEVTCDG
jgi:hypothetical protein